MTPAVRNILLVGALHVAIVASVGAKFAFDRATLPRAWVRAYATGPAFSMQGRYLRLGLGPRDTRNREAPVAFFIPEGAADPSRREPGEELWVEVTVPRQGPPRPIRLGVKKDGVLTPLELK